MTTAAMNVSEQLTVGRNHHRAGNLAAAEQIYRAILAGEPRHAEALHLLGVLAHQTGHPQPASELIRQAIAANPRAGYFHNNLGNALRDLGQFADARAAYETALRLEPRSADAHSNLGNVLRDQGHLPEAIDAYRRAAALQPDDADVHSNLGNALREMGRSQEALAECEVAVELDEKHAAAHGNLGNVYRDLGRFDEAVVAYDRALELQPDLVEACLNRGNVLLAQGKTSEAVKAYRWAVGTRPNLAEAHDGLGSTLRETGDLDEALAAARRAVELDPARVLSHLNLAVTLSERGDADGAFAAGRRAFELAPTQPETRLAYAHLLLLRGDYANGLPLYEARWDAPAFRSLHEPLAAPRWEGQPLTGQRVLIRAEQGFGDAIQFIRYASVVAARGGIAVVECPPALADLFRQVEGVSEVFPMGSPRPSFDLQVPLLSLPLVCGTTLETIPAAIPYLAAEAARQEAWRARLGADRSRLRVGLAWKGHAKNPGNALRSIPPEKLTPLLDLEGVDFYSLQKDGGPAPAEIFDRRLIDLTANLRDFSDTAALIGELDLVISIDSAALHLAGAMGRPAWGLLRFAADWRYLEGREDSPWYPSLRLFRQPSYRDWDSVVAVVRRELASLQANR
jgi:tetratricopeptide (TPR) repeat protein